MTCIADEGDKVWSKFEVNPPETNFLHSFTTWKVIYFAGYVWSRKFEKP